MFKPIRRFLSRLLRQLGLRQEYNLSLRYPQHSFGNGTYGNLIIRDYLETDDVKVGAYTSIGPAVQILLGADHRPDWVTTYPFNINNPKYGHIKGHPRSRGPVTIGSDVWIGMEAVIVSGVSIGDGAVVGARAFVNRDIPPYAIAVGMPAKVIGYRFDQRTIDRLLKIKWWEWPSSNVDGAIPDLLSSDIEKFCELAEEGRYAGK